MKNVLLALGLVLLGAGGAFAWLQWKDSGAEETPAGLCATHRIAEAECPWCHPELVERLGQCLEHGVPEALCSRCNPALIPGFEAENDWCAGHSIPESQCDLCKAGHLPPGEGR